jgi:hypothetical protein
VTDGQTTPQAPQEQLEDPIMAGASHRGERARVRMALETGQPRRVTQPDAAEPSTGLKVSLMQTLIQWLSETVTNTTFLEKLPNGLQLPEVFTRLQLYAALARLDKEADGRTGLTPEQAFLWCELRNWVGGWLRARPEDFEDYHRELRKINPLRPSPTPA